MTSGSTIAQRLGLDFGDLVHVGNALAMYADAHESEEAAASEFDWLARGHTLADAASLLWLADQPKAMELLASGAEAFSAAGSSFALVCGIASHGRARPHELPIGEPADGLLAAAWGALTDDERWRGFERWAEAPIGRSPLGVPYALLARLRDATASGLRPTVEVALLIAERADDALSEAMADRWHWERFAADVRPLEVELLAIGAIVRVAGGAEAGHELVEHAERPAAQVIAAGALAQELSSG